MQTNPTSSLRPLPPALIGAALDCLAQLPDGHRLDPVLLVSVARAIGCSNSETPALLTRIRAAAIIMNHPRWPVWPLIMKSASVEQRQIFDVAILTIIAELPLTADLTFSAGAFFDVLLARTLPHGRA